MSHINPWFSRKKFGSTKNIDMKVKRRSDSKSFTFYKIKLKIIFCQKKTQN